jgi:hypothetical protein
LFGDEGLTGDVGVSGSVTISSSASPVDEFKVVSNFKYENEKLYNLPSITTASLSLETNEFILIQTCCHGDDRLARRNSEMRNSCPDVFDLNHLELAVGGQPDLNVPHNVVPP